MTLVVDSLHKSYAGYPVLRGVDLTVAAGQVHALLGPNGAGKSTLIKCLGGVTAPDSGSVRLDGVELRDLTPSRAFEQGIATIHQHLTLVDSLSVTDNVFLGSERTRLGVRARRSQRADVLALLQRFRIDVSPDTAVGLLPIGTKQLIEIAKAWHRTKVRVLILDEPTASLSDRETERLFNEIEQLKQRGVRVVYITHRLAEVFRIADVVTVLRDGASVLHGQTSDITAADIVTAISRGGEVLTQAARSGMADQVVLTVRELTGPRFGPVSFDGRAGEVLGVYGPMGSGRTSLLETLAGRFSPTAGELMLDGKRFRPRGPANAIGRGVALVPADRHKQALLATRSSSENLLLPSYRRIGHSLWRARRREQHVFTNSAARLQLHPADPVRPAAAFSGGNQQKLVVGRWVAMAEHLRVLLLDEPTQGVDVGARRHIYQVLQGLARERNCLVLFSSAEADEIVALADRALVVDRGRIVAELTGDDISEDSLIRAAHQFVAEEAQ